MSQTTSEAAAQPAAAQTSAVEKPSGENVSGAQMKQILLQRDLAAKAPPTETAPASVETPSATPPVENQPASDSAPVDPLATTETPATENAAPAQMPESVLSNLSSLDPETRKWVETAVEEFKANQQAQIDKRIGKERAKRGDSERIAEQALQEVQALRQQLSQNQQQAPQPTPNSPLGNVQDLTALSAKRNEAVNIIGIVDDALSLNPTAEKIKVDGQEFERAHLIELKRNARDLLVKEIPARQDFLQQRNQMNQSALTDFPFLSDPSTPEYTRASNIIRQNHSWLQHQPDALRMVAVQVEGEKAIAARKTVQPVASKPAAPVARPPSSQTATTVSSAPERVSGEGRVKQAIESNVKKVSSASNMSGAQTRLFLKQQDMLRNQNR